MKRSYLSKACYDALSRYFFIGAAVIFSAGLLGVFIGGRFGHVMYKCIIAVYFICTLPKAIKIYRLEKRDNSDNLL